MSTGAPRAEPGEGIESLRELDVAPAPVRDTRGGGRVGIVALVVSLVAIAGAIAIARLPPMTLTTAPPTQAIATLTPTQEPMVSPATPAGSVSAAELRTALADGSLDGRIVTVQGTLTMTGDCGYGTDLCTMFGLEGLDGVPVTWVGPLVAPDQTANDLPAIALSGRLVLVPRGGGLLLLGRLKGSLEQPQTVGELVYQRRLLSFDPFVAQAVTGWLVRPQGGVCPSDAPRPGQCEATQVFLTDHAPVGWSVAAGAARMDVAAGTGPGLSVDNTVLDGSFLGRYAFDGACKRNQADVLDCSTLLWTWTIVAHYDPAEILALVLP